MWQQLDHGSTPSKNAEPTRTRVAPSSIAALEIARHAHRQFRQRSPVRWLSSSRVWRSRTNEGRADPASVPQAAIVISPTILTARQAAMASASLTTCSGDQPCLASSPEVFTCKQTGGAAGQLLRQGVEELKQLERVEPRGPSRPSATSAWPCSFASGRSDASERVQQDPPARSAFRQSSWG